MASDLFSNYPSNYPSRDEVIWSDCIEDIVAYSPGEYLVAGLVKGSDSEYVIKLNDGSWTRGSESRG